MTLDSSGASLPAVKPAPRGCGIPSVERPTAMPRGVEQHVADRIPDFPRCLEGTQVVPIRQQPTAPPECPSHCPGHSPAKRLHPTTERMATLCFDDEVRVVPQERVMHQPKLPTIASPHQRPLEIPHKGWSSQRRSTLMHSQGNVARMMRREPRPAQLPNQGIRPGLASRSLASPAVACRSP